MSENGEPNPEDIRILVDKTRSLVASLRPSLNAARLAARKIAPIRNKLSTLAESLDPLFRQIAPGTLLGDLLIVGRGQDENGRILATERLADSRWFQYPIYPARWSLLEPAIQSRAEAEGTSLRSVFRTSVVAALFLIVGESWTPKEGVRVGRSVIPGSVVPFEMDFTDYFQWLRAQVANTICEDFLGPGWRRTDDLPLEDEDARADAQQMAVEATAEARLWLEEQVRNAHLTDREYEVVLLTAEGRDGPQLAAALGVKHSTARELLSRARRKLNAA